MFVKLLFWEKEKRRRNPRELRLENEKRILYIAVMSRVEQIESQIEKLSPEEVRAVAHWLSEFQANLWDQEIEKDAQVGGKLRPLIEKAKQDFCSGHTRPLG
jgi:hypothetical protein